MPNPNLVVFLGGTIFGIVCAITLFVVEHYTQGALQERRRRVLGQQLLQQNRKASKAKQLRSREKNRKAESVVPSSTSENSDLDDFYDASDVELETSSLDLTLEEIDIKLDKSDVEELERILEKLIDLCIEHPEDPNLLWRIARTHYEIQKNSEDKTLIMEHCNKGIMACTSALRLKPELADVHKWLAMLMGCRSEHQPTKEKILDANALKKHAEIGVKLNPTDQVLHHMLGRYDFEIADLTWFQRQAVTAFFADLPGATYNEALEHLLLAEEYSPIPWKENKLFVAKCLIKLDNVKEAVKYLKEADNIAQDNNGEDDKVDAEVKELLYKYNFNN